MSIKNTIPISEARKEIFSIAKQVQKPGEFYTLTENGRPKVVILSAEEYESLVETLEVLRIFPNLGDDIRDADNELRRKTFVTLDEILTKEGYIKNNVGRGKDHEKVRRSHPTKGTKGSR